MASDNFKDQCSDMTKKFNIQLPCMLAERVEAFAKENDAECWMPENCRDGFRK